MIKFMCNQVNQIVINTGESLALGHSNPKALDDVSLKKCAKELGLRVSQFEQCYA
ncbi:MAG: hypothetical protein R8M38_02525 [Mariprofundaceae bacterium]